MISEMDVIVGKGKIGQNTPDTIDIILQKILQYLLSQILQTRLPVIVEVCRHAKLPYKIQSIVFSSSNSALS